ncbi:hypothetical protein HHK36_019813 [Tetracentron sinense]|uniref:Uncharacterized protein n=1 Tax=Tetracentron sinense TaxID=13715 RepID=A0A834YUA8_TETSI|nr:hypothetical protein HHK36_019813 [Tetracentron sinense]
MRPHVVNYWHGYQQDVLLTDSLNGYSDELIAALVMVIKALVEGVQEMAAMTGAVPAVEQREEFYDPLATPDVDKLNAAYLAVHGNTMLGRSLWMRTSALSEQA